MSFLRRLYEKRVERLLRMDFIFPGESPLIQKISFNLLLQKYEQWLHSDQAYLRDRAGA